MRRAPEPTTLRNFRFTRADDRAMALIRDAHPELGNDTAVIKYLLHKEASQFTEKKGGKR